MRYYEINEKLNENLSVFRFAVENKDVAEDICKRYPNLTYREIECTQTLMTDASPCIVPAEEPKGLYADVKCPYCGASHFKLGACWSTAVYYPTIIKDGKVISKDNNTVTQEYECLECGKTWKEDI